MQTGSGDTLGAWDFGTASPALPSGDVRVPTGAAPRRARLKHAQSPRPAVAAHEAPNNHATHAGVQAASSRDNRHATPRPRLSYSAARPQHRTRTPIDPRGTLSSVVGTRSRPRSARGTRSAGLVQENSMLKVIQQGLALRRRHRARGPLTVS